MSTRKFKILHKNNTKPFNKNETDTDTETLSENNIEENMDDKQYNIIHDFSSNKIQEINKNSNIIKNLYNVSVYCLKYVVFALKVFFKVSGIYLLWILFHYFAKRLYLIIIK
jgi:hypothetical protein